MKEPKGRSMKNPRRKAVKNKPKQRQIEIVPSAFFTSNEL